MSTGNESLVSKGVFPLYKGEAGLEFTPTPLKWIETVFGLGVMVLAGFREAQRVARIARVTARPSENGFTRAVL